MRRLTQTFSILGVLMHAATGRWAHVSHVCPFLIMVLFYLCLWHMPDMKKCRRLGRHGTVVRHVFVKLPTVCVLAFVILVYELLVGFSPVVKVDRVLLAKQQTRRSRTRL